MATYEDFVGCFFFKRGREWSAVLVQRTTLAHALFTSTTRHVQHQHLQQGNYTVFQAMTYFEIFNVWILTHNTNEASSRFGTPDL